MIRKGFFLVLVLFVFLLVGCVPTTSVASEIEKSFVEELSQLSTETPEIIHEEAFIKTLKMPQIEVCKISELAPTQNLTEVVTKTPAPYESQRQKIRALMEDYGFVEEYYLSDSYWSRLYERIDEFGVAEKIAALEFHGNNYSMYDGAYSMNPYEFYIQMEYLLKNQYHFVTIHELKGFLDGWLDLPKRSIILTTDSGYTSRESFESMMSQFSELESIYGYRVHMQSFIWTKGMTEEESSLCKEDVCWKTFLRAKESGFFTFGTHSQTHPEFEFQTTEFLKEDLEISIEKIRENIGLNVYAIAWPHESCSWDLEALEEISIDIGFGGLSKHTSDAFVYKNDQMYNCLPRLFPPNPGGYSSRPYGFTLEDILNAQEN